MRSVGTMRCVSAGIGVLLGLAGCTSSEATDEPGTTSSGDATTGSEGADASSTDDPPMAVPDVAAHDDVPVGVGIVDVVIAQGSSLPLVRNGLAVATPDRGGGIVAGRAAAIVVGYEAAADWTPRTIVAELTLQTAGETMTLTAEHMVEPGVVAALDGFQFMVEPAHLQADTQWSIALRETEARPQLSGAVTSPSALPGDDTLAPLDVVDAPHRLEIVIVPFDYDDGAGCSTSPQLDEATLATMRDTLYQQMPVDEIVLTMHARETWTEPFEALIDINERLIELRMAEAALPQTVYYGVIDACLPATGVTGMAYGMLVPTSMEMSFTRCAAGLWWDDDLDTVADTFVHEVAHTLGRLHVTCGGGEGFPLDTAYPVEGGGLDAWGFGVLDGVLRPAEGMADYMTYCDPSWLSQHGWNELEPVIATISGWPMKAPVPTGRLIVGHVGSDGDDRWQVLPGDLAASKTGDRVEVEIVVDGVTQRVDGRVVAIADAPGHALVVAAAPGDGEVVVTRWRALATRE